jgi:ubiquitin C-terminal hydrolase
MTQLVDQHAEKNAQHTDQSQLQVVACPNHERRRQPKKRMHTHRNPKDLKIQIKFTVTG